MNLGIERIGYSQRLQLITNRPHHLSDFETKAVYEAES